GSTDSDGTIVEYAWDWDGNGGYEEITLSAVHSHVFTASGSPAVIVGVKDDDGAWDTATVAIDVNAPPVAALTVTPEDGIDPGEPIYLYAAGSSDSDGSIADYEWDFDNDGTYNETNNDEDDAQGLDNVILSPEDIGDYTVGLRVTDDDGATHATIADFTVHGWLVVTVDSAGNVGYDNSLAVVDGCPAISYYDNTNKDLKYARATTSTGASASDWSQIVTVESSAGTIGLYTSLAVVDGCPAISYYDSTNDNLKYARATTSTGGSTSGWTQKVVVDYTGDVGRYTSLAVIDGCPAISYFDSTNDDLKYARATTGTGASASDWTQIVTVDSTGNVGFITSLAVVDGYPAISYYDQSNQDLKYARATTSTGGSASDWTQIVTVDSTGNVGDFTSLAVVAGCPAISYLDTSNFDLKYARATTSTGGSVGDWTQIITVESTGIVGLYSSLAIINGCPMIAYQDDSNNKVRFATSSTVTGSDSADWSMESPATGATTGEYSSLAEVNGYAAASFYDAVSDDLRYAILF
ncbi:PKD domain-containing protein, partial [bacterium]|nr:PKD domain-containing protein [bacterium]